MTQARRPFRRGAILAVALATLLVVTLLAGVVIRGYLQSYRQMRLIQDKTQAEWLADSGLARAHARRKVDPSYAGETWQIELQTANGKSAAAVVSIKIELKSDESNAGQIIVESRFPAADAEGIRSQRTLNLPPTDN
jgi:Tfp pilus assembly protein PilX